MDYKKNINGKLALGYGSKYQLLRMLGWHRNDFNQIIAQCLGIDTNINWFDFIYLDSQRDGERLNLDFISDLINNEWLGAWACGKGKGINWDAVGKSADGTYILVEAKANLDEVKNCPKGQNESQMKNNKIIEEFQKRYNINSTPEIWCNGHYQLANRLVITDFLLSHGFNVKLVYILFEHGYEYNCATNKSASKEAWEKVLQKEYNEMGIAGTKVEELINICYIDCNKKD